MTEAALTTPTQTVELDSTAAATKPALFDLRSQAAMLSAFVFMAATATAQSTGGGGGGLVDLSGITSLICNIATQLKAPTLLGAAATVIVLIFGWNKLMGEGSAFQGLKNGVIGGIIILGAGTIISALFKGATACG